MESTKAYNTTETVGDNTLAPAGPFANKVMSHLHLCKFLTMLTGK